MLSGGVGGWGHKFLDMGGAISRYRRCCFDIWEVLFRDRGGAELGHGRREHVLYTVGLVALWLVSQGSQGRGELGLLSVNYEQFRDMLGYNGID